MPADDGLALLGAVDGRVGNLAHQFGQCTAVVYLVVLHHDVVNLFQVYLLLQSTDELAVVGLPDSVDERRLLVAHQIGVITGTTVRGILVAVKTCQFPVDLADPTDLGGNLLCHCAFLNFSF